MMLGKTCVRDRMSEKLWENMWQLQQAHKQIVKKLLKATDEALRERTHGFSSEWFHKSNSVLVQTPPSSSPLSLYSKFAGKFT